MLRTIKGAAMLSAAKDYEAPVVSKDEQVRLFNNIKRTVGAANMIGSSGLEAEYWDDFFVRGIELLTVSDQQVPVKRSRKENVEDAAKTPFIYNAFAKTAAVRAESVLIAGEWAAFKVTLQNPFQIDLEVESLRLEGEGVPFQASLESFWLGPLCLEELTIPVLAATEGTLKITGCVVKVRYCKARRFPFFSKLWRPEFASKLKRTGLAARGQLSERPTSWASATPAPGIELAVKGPEAETMSVTVIEQQPVVVVDPTTLAQSAIMLLEGETRSFDITLRNTSSRPVDLVHFTFQDSTTTQLQSAIQSKENLPTDLYELELQLVTNPVLKMRRPENDDDFMVIPAGEKATFTIDVFGKAGLFDAQVLIDYGYTGVSRSALPESFYVRQIVMPLTITVNASAEVVRCDIFPLGDDFTSDDIAHLPAEEESSSSKRSSSSSSTPEDGSPALKALSHLGIGGSDTGRCLLLFDVRNNWPHPLTTSLLLDGEWKGHAPGASSADPVLPSKETEEILDEIQPGHVSRMALVIPRIFIENPRKPIPSLNSGFRRQFVVSSQKLSFDAEVSSREAFWDREELLKHIRGRWKDNVTRREGSLGLRGVRLNDRMIDILRVDDVDVAFSLESAEPDPPAKEVEHDNVARTSPSKYTVKTNSFLLLRVTIINRSLKPVHPLLRLQPSLHNQPHNIALELSKRLAWTGMLQRALPAIGAGETAQATLGLTVLCRGEYDIGASVEEVRALNPLPASHPGIETGEATPPGMPDALQEAFKKGAANRCIWHSRVPCTIIAQD
jgi:hypothetical protein